MLAQAQNLSNELVTVRRYLHQHPETGMNEIETSKYIREELSKMGVEILDLGLKVGVVGLIKGSKMGRTVALRADIDALPIQETNNIEFKSCNAGVSHACGHDIHITCLLGAAKLLMMQKEHLAGNIKLIFQPAEEIDEGANYMIEHRVLENVDAIFGLHDDPDIPVGKIGVKAGAMRAAIDKFVIRIKGVGGHGAEPQFTKDPVVAAAAVIQAMQTIVARNVSPLETAVVSCCTIHAGEIYNVIPTDVEIMGTARMFNPSLRNSMPERLRNLVVNIAGGLGTNATVEYINELPPLLNPLEIVKFCQKSACEILGEENVVTHQPSMVGDDFAIYQEKVPGVFFLLGVGNKNNNRPLHSSDFMADENSLPIGAAVMAKFAIDYLKKLRM